MAKTISVDEETYGELVKLTGNLMEKAGEQISVGQVARLAVAYLRGSLNHFPGLEKAILDLIDFEEQRGKYSSIHEITSEWFDKDFLELVLGIKEVNDSDESVGSLNEIREKGVTRIYGYDKRNMYEAEITVDSKVKTLHDGKEHDSLSGAASAIRGYPENGWRFWKYEDKDGCHPLKTLRDSLKR